MLELYVGCLIVGGGLVALSFFADHDSDADHDHDLDAEHDFDLGIDADADADADHDLEGGGIGAADALWMPLLSLRFWIFFSAFFGLTGSLLHGVGALTQGGPSAGVILGLAIALGLVAGYTISTLIRKLRTQHVTSGVSPRRDYVGSRGKVLLAVEPGDPGRVRLHLKGIDIDLPACLAAGEKALARNAEVVVLEYKGGDLVVAPFSMEDERPRRGRESA